MTFKQLMNDRLAYSSPDDEGVPGGPAVAPSDEGNAPPSNDAPPAWAQGLLEEVTNLKGELASMRAPAAPVAPPAASDEEDDYPYTPTEWNAYKSKQDQKLEKILNERLGQIQGQFGNMVGGVVRSSAVQALSSGFDEYQRAALDEILKDVPADALSGMLQTPAIVEGIRERAIGRAFSKRPPSVTPPSGSDLTGGVDTEGYSAVDRRAIDEMEKALKPFGGTRKNAIAAFERARGN